MSTPKTFTAGQLVYDINGRTGSYVSTFSGGHLVEPIYDCSDDEDAHFGHVQEWREVFSSPPTERLTSDIAELVAEIAAKRVELSSIQDSIFDAERQRNVLLLHAKQNPQLADLGLWLEGKVTHIVVPSRYHIEIGTVEDVLRKNDRDRELRLLSLYVDPKANRYWVGRSAYSDGSSGYQPCFLASSEEHAKEQARAHIAANLRDYNSRNDTSWIRLAIEFGVPVTEEQLEVLAKENATNAAAQLKRAQDAVAAAKAGLDKAELEFAQVNGGAA